MAGEEFEPWQAGDGARDPEDDERLGRARACKDDTERVAFILDEMLACTWQPGKDARRMSVLWQLPVTRIFHLTSKAARLYRAGMDPEEMRAKMTAGLEYLLEKALNATVYDFKSGQSIPMPDLKNAIDSIRLQAHVNGMLTDKHEISGPGGGPLGAIVADIRRLSPEELEAKIVEEGDRIRKARGEVSVAALVPILTAKKDDDGSAGD